MADDPFARALLQKREELDAWYAMVTRDYQQRVAAINLLLDDSGQDSLVSNVSSDPDEEVEGDGPTTREYIRDVLADGHVKRMVDVVTAVKDGPSPASADTIRSVLQKMARSGEVEKVGRGTYRLAGMRNPGLDDDLFDLSGEEPEAD
jgi:hypothetical protein